MRYRNVKNIGTMLILWDSDKERDEALHGRPPETVVANDETRYILSLVREDLESARQTVAFLEEWLALHAATFEG